MARIIRQVTVCRDGMHNAFTDLQHWQNLYWAGYRKGTGHVSMDGEAVLAVSGDRQRFREVARLKVRGDVRDPKLVVMAEDRMAMIFPSWVEGAAARKLQQYVTFSSDGCNWQTPTPILEPNHWLWRVVKHGDTYYGASYSFREGKEAHERQYKLELMKSSDMLHWETISQVGTEAMSLGETGIHFRPDGECWLVIRTSRPSTNVARFASARPPYTQWEISDLDVMIHAPVILEHNDALYVAGRRQVDQEGDTTFPFLDRMSIGVWRLERGKVTPVLRIPATGDCSYCGLIKAPDGVVCMSYYSQHAYAMGVVNDVYVRDGKPPHRVGNVLPQADIYFAELELD